MAWLTNLPDCLSGMTDQPTYLTIWVDWPTNIPAFLSGLSDWQTYLTIYPYWFVCIVSVLSAAYQCMPITHLHIRTDWPAFLFCLLIIISAYLSCLPIRADWLPIRADWLTNTLLPTYIYLGWLPFSLIDHHAYVPRLHTCLVNYRPTYMPTYVSWLINISAFLSCLTYQGWLTDQRTCLPAWADWLTKPTGRGWLTNKYTCLPIRADTDKKACLPTNLLQYTCTCLLNLADRPTSIPAYQSELTVHFQNICPSVSADWLTILPSYTAYVSGLTDSPNKVAAYHGWPTNNHQCI